ENAERMVGDRYQGSLGGDAFEIGRLNLKVDLHLAQQGFKAEAVRSRAHTLIERSYLRHWHQFSRKLRQAGKIRRTGQEGPTMVAYAWRSTHNKFSPSFLCSRVKKRLKLREQSPRK